MANFEAFLLPWVYIPEKGQRPAEGNCGPFKGILRFLKAVFSRPKRRFQSCDKRDNCAAAGFILQRVKLAKSLKLSMVRSQGEFPELGSGHRVRKALVLLNTISSLLRITYQIMRNMNNYNMLIFSKLST